MLFLQQKNKMKNKLDANEKNNISQSTFLDRMSMPSVEKFEPAPPKKGSKRKSKNKKN